MSLTLTKNGVPLLLQTENRINQNILVQVINLKPLKNEKHFPCHISDGFHKIKAAIAVGNPKFNPDQHNFVLIRIKQHTIIKVGQILRGVEIQQFDIEGAYPEQIGDPVNYSEQVQISEHANNHIDPDKMKAKNAKKKPIEILQSQKKGPIVISFDDQQEDITQRRLKDSDKISDLYADLANWEIVCRVTDMNFKEFVSKKSQKFTQILTLELMDRTGMKIQGTVFGQFAKELKGKLVINGLYRISKGQIREENFNTNKGPKYSRFNINFNQNAIFTPLHDNALIPQFDQNAYYSVHQVITEKDWEKQYDMVGILTQVGEQKQFTDKQGKPLTKRNISVADPENNQTIEITLWRDVKFDQNLLGKTILLKNFKLNNYNGNVTLNSLFKSEIKPVQHHRYRQYEGDLNPDKFKQVSQAPQVDHSGDCRTIKKLQNEIQYMDGQTIYSNLNAYVSLISFKNKWYYESCPKCKRGGAESNSTCIHCQTLIEQPISRFILPIQIADFTGSIWTTAFDEFANVLLQGKDISFLKICDQVKLRQQGEKKIFQEFKFRISTKKESGGQVKHTIVGKPQQINPQRVALQNLHRIYEYE